MLKRPAPVVVLRHADVRLASRRVLVDLTWKLAPDEHWAVLGANASGKTSLLRLLAGELWPAPGRTGQRLYDFGDGPERDAVQARTRIRLVTPELQDRYYRYRWNPIGQTLIATGFLDAPILRHPLTADQAKIVADVMQLLDSEDLVRRRFLELSRGEQRRLLLARALVARPRVLLLDEICDGVDTVGRRRLLDNLDALARRGTQLVFATHRRDEVPGCINRYLVLSAGRIAESGVYPLPAAADAEADPVPRPEVDATRERIPRVLIRVEKADVYRGNQKVLRNLNWQLAVGENWLIRGPNGSGKSTFIKLLHGDLRPALGGRIAWFDLPGPVNVWTLRQRLGLVSDELQGLYGDAITVRDCVATGFNASVGRVPRLDASQRNQTEACLTDAGLLDIATASVRCLSYGQVRRVLLARALVQQPEVLLLDEPFTGLDPRQTELMWSLLTQMHGRGTRLILASHEPVPPDLFTHSLDLEHGRATALSLT